MGKDNKMSLFHKTFLVAVVVVYLFPACCHGDVSGLWRGLAGLTAWPAVVARARYRGNRPVPDFVLQVDTHLNTTALFYAYRERSRGAGGLPWEAPLPEGWTEGPGGPEGPARGSGAAAYDGEGAMWFAVAVILIYGVSIALLVGTTLHRSHTDYEVKGFLRSYARLDQQRRTSEKQRVRQRLLQRPLLPMLPGCSLAVAPHCLQRRPEGLHDLAEDPGERGEVDSEGLQSGPSSGDREQYTGDSTSTGPFAWDLPATPPPGLPPTPLSGRACPGAGQRNRPWAQAPTLPSYPPVWPAGRQLCQVPPPRRTPHPQAFPLTKPPFLPRRLAGPPRAVTRPPGPPPPSTLATPACSPLTGTNTSLQSADIASDSTRKSSLDLSEAPSTCGSSSRDLLPAGLPGISSGLSSEPRGYDNPLHARAGSDGLSGEVGLGGGAVECLPQTEGESSPGPGVPPSDPAPGPRGHHHRASSV